MGRSKSLVMLAGAAVSLSAACAFGQQSNDETRSVVAEMLADSETRSSLLSAGDAGHDGRFFIAGDGYRLNISGLLQTRYYANFRDDSNEDDFESGFQIGRAKVSFQGDINKDWFFHVRGAFENADEGNFQLDYGYAGYKFANGNRLTMGQFKLPLLREELVSDSKQLAVERSLTNAAYTQGYSQGIMLDQELESWRWSVAFSDGLNTANTDFTDNEDTVPFAVMNEGDYAFTGRVEFLFGGNWRMFEDFTAAKGQDFGFMLGAAGHWQQSANSNDPTDADRSTFEFTVDASLEGDSWNVFAAYIGRYDDVTALGAGDSDVYNSGFIVQGGWRFAENTELFARWDSILADSDFPAFTGGEDNFNFLTAGVNHYFAGHAAKGTLDLVWSFEDTTNLVNSDLLPNTGVGLLGDSEENEIVIRAQFQLMF